MCKESASAYEDEFIGCLKDEEILDQVPECWKLELNIAGEAVRHNGRFLSYHSRGKPCLVLEGVESGIECRIYTDAKDQPVILKIPAVSLKTEMDAEILVTYLSYKAELYLNGKLMDEDWPLGAFGRTGMKVRLQQDIVKAVRFSSIKGKTESCPAIFESFTGPVDYWTPPGFNTSVGDCMPFSYGGRFHLFYLLDRRGHRSKYGLGAHQWAHISTTDLKSWDIHPMAVAIDRQWEGSICTGSVFHDRGVYYAYYAVRMSDGSAARLS